MTRRMSLFLFDEEWEQLRERGDHLQPWERVTLVMAKYLGQEIPSTKSGQREWIEDRRIAQMAEGFHVLEPGEGNRVVDRVWKALESEPLTMTQLSSRLGTGRSTLSKILSENQGKLFEVVGTGARRANVWRRVDKKEHRAGRLTRHDLTLLTNWLEDNGPAELLTMERELKIKRSTLRLMLKGHPERFLISGERRGRGRGKPAHLWAVRTDDDPE